VSPITHLLVGWTVATAARLEPRDRALVALASVVPDLDGLGIVVDLATAKTGHATEWWGAYHHTLAHNLAAALVATAAAATLARRRVLASALVFLSFHLHLLGDLAGSRGPDGYQWPIPYLTPFSEGLALVWSGQWALNAWPNFALTGVLLAWAFHVAWKRGVSPLEMLSQRADRAFVQALRQRFGSPQPAA
jgi:hypothetical protein